MTKKVLRLFLAVALVFGSLLFISIGDIFAAPPVVNGVVDNQYYNTPVTITFDDVGGTVTATLNTVLIPSGTIVTVDGSYILIVTDGVETTTINFWIDTIDPVVTEVVNNTYYNGSVTPIITDASPFNATLNGAVYAPGTPITADGVYELVVTDSATNVTTVNFVIDTIEPVVTGVIDGSYYKDPPKAAVFTDATATLNGLTYLSGAPIEDDGFYTLVVTDLATNVTTITFTIDTIKPVVTDVVDNTYYNGTVTPVITDASPFEAKLNGAIYESGTPITADGVYELIVTDSATNITTVNFVIDTIDPVVTGVIDGSYYKDPPKAAVFTDATATLNGLTYLSGAPIEDDGFYTLVVTDLANNVTTITFTIDTIEPVVTGVIDGSYYNDPPKAAVFTDATATLNDVAYISGTPIEDDGFYTLVVTDLATNVTTITFTIDTIKPVVTDVVDNTYYNGTVTPVITDASPFEAKLNGAIYESGTPITADGVYELIVTDSATNVTTVNFVIDTIDPVVTGVIDGSYYNDPPKAAVFTDATATLNGLTYLSGAPIEDDGFYTLVVTDLANNVTTITFTIDTIEPVVTGVIDGSYYNDPPKTAVFTDATATLNDVAYISGTPIEDDGFYTLVVTDLANNVTTITFSIDTIDPVVTGVIEGAYYNNPPKAAVFTDATASLNDVAYISGTPISADGVYELIVTDLATNVTVVNFTIDTIAPIVGGVVNNTYYNTNRTITFNEGTALLNDVAITTGTVVSVEDTYVLEVTDLAGNKTTVNFVVDKTPPVITIAPYESVLAVSSVTVNASVNEGSLNSTSRLFTANGSYKFIATDLAGNVSERTVTISNIGYTINYSLVGTGGDLIAMVNSIVVNSGNLVIEGRSIMFTATPATRYRVYAWRLDGNVVGDRSNTYLLNMLNRGMNVTVEFVLEGDLNNSGTVSITDLVILRRYLAGLETINDKAKVAADVNNSGGVSITDLVILRRRLAGLE